MGKAVIKLQSQNVEEIDEVCRQIKDIASRAGVAMKGPIPLPTKRLRISTRRTPCGDGSDTYEKWELRVHKRLIEVFDDGRILKEITRIRIPSSVDIKMKYEN